MGKVFQAFDTLESTEQMKQQISGIVNKRIEEMKKYSKNVNKWEITTNVMENLIERRGECNHDLYKSFFLRYLTPHMRETLWKGLL